MSKKEELFNQLLQESIKEKIMEQVEGQFHNIDIEKLVKENMTLDIVKEKIIEIIKDDFISIFNEEYFQEIIQNNKEFFQAKMFDLLKEAMDKPQSKKEMVKAIQVNYLDDISGYCEVSDLFEDAFKRYEIRFVEKTPLGKEKI
jgi:hypothetical protein